VKEEKEEEGENTRRVKPGEVRRERMKRRKIRKWRRKWRMERGRDKRIKLFIPARFCRRCKGKGQFVLVYAMKACRGSIGIAPRIRNLGTRWR
jgi:hypothetical protein